MSEGINFSDAMARCVVMLGLPYANVASAELREKMAWLDKTQGHGAGRNYYEALCMKAVNQSIGRAIRHANDFATILLLDQRYCTRRDVRDALPKWIAHKLRPHDHFQAAVADLKQFFAVDRGTKSLTQAR